MDPSKIEEELDTVEAYAKGKSIPFTAKVYLQALVAKVRELRAVINEAEEQDEEDEAEEEVVAPGPSKDQRDNLPHPTQPIALDEKGVERFKKNQIVRDLLNLAPVHGLDMNRMACSAYTNEDRVQFVQLIGYSLCGFGELSSYVSKRAYDRAVTEGKAGKHK